jgi:hypothetical protein
MLALSPDKLWSIRAFAADYYGSQWSRLYRLMCRADHLMALRGHHARTPEYHDYMMDRARLTPMYAELVAKYGGE